MIRTTLFLIFSSQFLFAQNYIVNGSFERIPPTKGKLISELTPCSFTSSPELFNWQVESWHTYKMVTPDIFCTDSTTVCPADLALPHSGHRMLGLILYLPGTDGDHAFDYHEYVEGRLGRALVPGQRYQLSFWVKEAKQAAANHLKGLGGKAVKSAPVNCGNLGFYFSTQASSENENIRMSIFDFGMKPQVNFKEIIATDGVWQKRTAEFVADRPYQYFIVGNFYSDGNTPTDLSPERHSAIDAFNAQQSNNWKKEIRIAYYFFDDFVITPINTPADVPSPTKAPKPMAAQLIDRQKIILASTLLFDVDKAHLNRTKIAELDTIAKVLRVNPAIKIEITGHTDNTGTAVYNQDLSERRAAAVRDYLLLLGVATEQLVIKGMGPSVPIATNDTEAGRAENRRVEIRRL